MNIFLPISFNNLFWGAQKNCLNETVLLSTHNIHFGKETRKLILNYELLSRVLLDNWVSG